MKGKVNPIKKIAVACLLAVSAATPVVAITMPVTVQAATKNGWKKENGGFKYYKNGKAYIGWHKMGKAEGEKTEHWSYFGKDGKIYTGWHKMGKREGEKTEHWSYFGNNGWLRTGWKWMDKKEGEKTPHWSYFGSNGWLRTGWKWMDKKEGEKTPHWSYFGSNGWLRTGWQDMGKGTSNPDGNLKKHKSYFGNNGWLRTGFQTIDGKNYSFDGNGWLKYSNISVAPKQDPEKVWKGIYKIEVRLQNGMHIYLPSFRDDFREGSHYVNYGYMYRNIEEHLDYYKIKRIDGYTDLFYYGKDYFQIKSNFLYVATQDDILTVAGFDSTRVQTNSNTDKYRLFAQKGRRKYYFDFSVLEVPIVSWGGEAGHYYRKYADKIVNSAWVE